MCDRGDIIGCCRGYVCLLLETSRAPKDPVQLRDVDRHFKFEGGAVAYVVNQTRAITTIKGRYIFQEAVSRHDASSTTPDGDVRHVDQNPWNMRCRLNLPP